MPEDVTVVDLADKAGIAKDIEVTEIQGLISFDELVMNFLQQHATAKDEFNKLQEALDNMHYTSTITKISLEELQEKKDLLTRLTGAVEALALYKKHVDPNCTERDFIFNDED
tara:strand:+ start:196 stop:534 length:339 start_codon:yes stop_codon:yes gene_type:complete